MKNTEAKGINTIRFGKFPMFYNSNGYQVIHVSGVPVQLHVYVWESKNGKRPIGHIIHHLDFNKRNYRLSNLELVTVSDHRKIHSGWVRLRGEWIARPCNKCHKVKPLDEFYFNKVRGIPCGYCIECKKREYRSPEYREYQRNRHKCHEGVMKCGECAKWVGWERVIRKDGSFGYSMVCGVDFNTGLDAPNTPCRHPGKFEQKGEREARDG